MAKDEKYVIDLCDEVLGRQGQRQHRFSFLLGDAGKNGRCCRLPVDVYYADLALVIEYREKQHSEAVPFMDRRQTVSGCSRGEQRKRYDARRREILPQNGIDLIEFDYTMFPHDSRKRMQRDPVGDAAVVLLRLAGFLQKRTQSSSQF